MVYSERSDTCGFPPSSPSPPIPWLITVEEGLVMITENRDGACREAAYEFDSGILRRVSGGLFVDAGGGPACQADVISTQALGFTTELFLGDDTLDYSPNPASGPCPNRTYPCTRIVDMTGERCEDCWPGC